MGFDRLDVIHDIHDGDGGGGKALSPSNVSCSICLELVIDDGDRSWAKLQCGHQFHLDCIGSAFNVKGVMQCPNCRKIEKGQWLYASGYRSTSFPEISLEDWPQDEDLYDLTYSEMSFGVQWCPFTAFSRPPTSFDEPEFQSSAYHDFLGQSAVFAEHTAVSSAAHPCPYFAYYGPFHSSSSSSAGSVSDGSTFSNHWSGPPSGSIDMPTSYGFPATDPHYHNWEHHLSTTGSQIGNAEQPSVGSITQQSYRSNTDAARSGSFVHPIFVSHSSGSRGGSSVTSSVIPPYPGSAARARDRAQALQAYFQPPSGSPPIRAPGSRRSNGHRGLTQAGTIAQSSDHTGGFFVFPSGSSDRNFPEAENPMSSRFHGWERENWTFPFSQVEREPNWGGFHQTGGGSSSFRQLHGSERTPSQSRS
ncbi:hypothetical protein Dimus_021690 [Dionaea muscipula]